MLAAAAQDDAGWAVSNCWFWARVEYWRRKRAWVRAGKPKGGEPYWVKRPSRSEPRVISHYLVGALDAESGQLQLRSYKPLVPEDVPLWRAWEHFFFAGSVRDGDRPDNPEVASS